jgi:hypothetical protein
MEARNRTWKRVFAAGGFIVLGTTITLLPAAPRVSAGSVLTGLWERHSCTAPFAGCGEEPPTAEIGGAWYWLRSPEQEKRVVSGLFNRYCIRCHGVDGRGIWDIPDVPNFTNARWQASHTDGQLARSILEGRGSVMPPWRGVVSLEEAWALARYVRTLAPGSEASRPDFSAPEKVAPLPQAPAKPK